MINLLYMAYGSSRHIEEASFAVLSALAHLRNDNGRVIVVTDQPDAFKEYPVTIEQIDSKIWEDWCGPDNYLYRAKIRIFQFIFERHPSDTLYVDADTYFMRSPMVVAQRLRPGHSIMDRPDGLVFSDNRNRSVAESFRTAFPDLMVTLANGSSFAFSESQSVMWIAGIVGIHYDDRHVVDQVLAVNDAAYHKARYFNIEQLAFSEVLRQQTHVQRADDVIHHYWSDWVDPYFGLSKRQFYMDQFRNFFRSVEGRPMKEKIEACRRFQPRPFRRPLSFRIVNRVRRSLGLGGLS